MKKSLRLLALIAALATSVAAFSSCSGGSDASSGGSDASSDTSTESGTGSESSTAVDPANAPTLRWIQIGGQPNDIEEVTDALNEYSAEKIGVKVEFTFLDWGVWGERVKAMLQGGEPFDIMFNTSDIYVSAINLGSFADITDMLSEVPDLVEFIPDDVWSGVTIDDRIYAVPTYKDSAQTQYWVWDKEVVDMLGIEYENIHTYADLDEPLHLVQEAINDGRITKCNYAFPTVKGGVNGFMMNYDAGVAGLGVRYDDETATVVRVHEQEDLMEQYTYMHKWYEEGIINPDASTAAEGELGSYCVVGSAQGFPGAETGWAQGRGCDEVVIEAWGGPVYSTGTIQGSINSISSNSEYKSEALKYLQLVNTDANYRNMLAYGIEGEHYIDNGDGTVERDQTVIPGAADYGPASYAQGTYMLLKPVSPNSPDMYQKLEEMNETAERSVLLGFTFNRTGPTDSDPDAVNVEAQVAACSAIIDRYSPELYTGVGDPAVLVPQMYSELEAAGLEDIRAELQRQIDNYLGK